MSAPRQHDARQRHLQDHMMMEKRFANLARVVGDWSARSGATDAEADAEAEGWASVELALRKRGAPLSGRRLGAVTATAALAVLGLMLVRGSGRVEPKLGFVVAGDSLSFSDGSEVILRAGARGNVIATTARGAHLRLEEGRARFTVAHRPGADWTVEVGPFVVIVHGTVFDVSWSKQSGDLAVDLLAGSITVRGPSEFIPTGTVTLRSGQRLTARSAGVVPAVETAPAVSPRQPADAVVIEPLTRRHRQPSLGAQWGGKVAVGEFQSVVAEADALGVERCLAQAPLGALTALADAARYLRRTELARSALLAERRRFPGSAAASDAAFLIGRMADDAPGADSDHRREALRWYDRYLEEAAHGTYGSEALGRKMVALERLGETAAARSTAEAYLERYPEEAFAPRARAITMRER